MGRHQDLYSRSLGPATSPSLEATSARWSTRRTVVIVALVNLLAWAAVIVSLTGL